MIRLSLMARAEYRNDARFFPPKAVNCRPDYRPKKKNIRMSRRQRKQT